MSAYISRGSETLPWWLVLVEGTIAVLLGLFLLIAPGAALVLMVQVLGLYLFIAGIFRIISIFVDNAWWGWKLLGGMLSIIAGLLVLEHPLWSTVMVPTVLVFVVGFLCIFQGAANLVVAFQGGGWGVGVLAVLGIVFGLVLVIYPLIGVGALPIALGAIMVVGGIAAVGQALRMR